MANITRIKEFFQNEKFQILLLIASATIAIIFCAIWKHGGSHEPAIVSIMALAVIVIAIVSESKHDSVSNLAFDTMLLFAFGAIVMMFQNPI